MDTLAGWLKRGLSVTLILLAALWPLQVTSAQGKSLTLGQTKGLILNYAEGSALPAPACPDGQSRVPPRPGPDGTGQAQVSQVEGLQIRITQVDNSKFPQVTVYVLVMDVAGEPVSVDPNQITIYENEQPMQLEQVSGSGDIGPLTTLLVLDVSGSMYDAGKLTAAKAAAQAYIEQMRPGDQAGLLIFNTDVSYRQPITADREALIRAVNDLRARGDTAMFDALDQAVQILQDVPGRKAIIVLTDGLDNRSHYTADEVIQAIGPGGLSISTIGLGDPTKLGINSGLDEAALKSLAERAGGVYGYINDPGALRSLYERYGRTLQSEYRLTYTSPSNLRDGINRTLTVSLKRQGGEAASARAQYNPGGVLPEVVHNVSWPLFGALLGGLVALLFVPMLASRGAQALGNRGGVVRKKKPRIKLK